ncbi:MAG: DUF1015 domain-containing protein, partial [Actinomycetota bacterium]|nr:DUF1015 domain-containing protein [Actinomycetota bacterium]
MADIQPLRAVRYEPAKVGSLEAVIAPPYDVIDDSLRRELKARSPFNVVEIDLPRSPDGGDPYAEAGETFEAWQADGVLTREAEPALWMLEQRFAAPDGGERRRRGFFARVRVTDYGR